MVITCASKGDLAQEISRVVRRESPPLNDERISKYFTQICLAIKYMHKMYVIHRDLKSLNIFLMQNDDVAVGDFGLAKQLASANAFCTVRVGTPAYRSPEVTQKKRYSYPADMWSLGIVLYEMIALKLPFREKIWTYYCTTSSTVLFPHSRILLPQTTPCPG